VFNGLIVEILADRASELVQAPIKGSVEVSVIDSVVTPPEN
jgi:hypothetical protein